MPTMIIHLDGKPPEDVVLDKEFTLIGRSVGADIRIDDVDDIEERASIVKVGETYVLNGLGDTGGIHVNGQPVKKRILHDRDLVTIGDYRMTFQDKREGGKPVGIEREVAEVRPQANMLGRQAKSSDPFRSGSGDKSKVVIYAILGAIVAGVCFASYQSYIDRKATDAREKSAYQESRRKEAEDVRQNAQVSQPASSPNDSPAETPASAR